MTPTLSALNPEIWVDEHGAYLLQYARIRVTREAMAEDLVQETFLAAWKARDRFRGLSSERTWLTGILRHKILDYLRKSKLDRLPLEDDGELEDCFDQWGHWSSKSTLRPELWAMDPSSLLESQEFQDALKRCLSSLAPRAAEAFLLQEVEEASPKEIARILEVTMTNLYTLLHRARFQLRACLQKTWPTPKTLISPH